MLASITNRSSSGFARSMRLPSSRSSAHTARKSRMKRSKAGRYCAMSLFPEFGSFDGAAAQQAAFVFGEVRSRMDRAAVVPHQKVAQPPDVFVDELAPFADLVELAQNRSTFLIGEAFDARGHQPVDEQA